MKSLFDPATVHELAARLAELHPAATRHWGKMNAAQMLAHCCLTMEMALGVRTAPRTLMGRIFGRLAKRSLLVDGKPMRRNATSPTLYVVTEERDFAGERQRLLALLERFAAGGPEACTTRPHNFFGPLTPQEWAAFMYVHLDHHLRQFGA